jgi:hypothetical protein
VPPPQQSAASAFFSQAVDEVTGFVKKALKRADQFSGFQGKGAQPAPQGQAAFGYAPQAPGIFGAPEAPRDQMSGASLLDAPGQQWKVPTPGRDARKPQKKAVHLTPAKKLLKVTGGRAMANAEELTEFKNTLTTESIDELVEALEDKEWKVKVRAILGLEVVAERYGLPAVAKAKQQVLMLNGAPQASLRTAATRFYAAIKDVVPAEPNAELSAFSFLDDGAEPEEPEEAEQVPVEATDTQEQVPQEKAVNEGGQVNEETPNEEGQGNDEAPANEAPEEQQDPGNE